LSGRVDRERDEERKDGDGRREAILKKRTTNLFLFNQTIRTTIRILLLFIERTAAELNEELHQEI